MTTGDGVIVSQKLAARLWPGRAAVGEWIREGRSGRQLRVIGVAADVKHHMLAETPREYLYRPLLPSEYADTVTLIARTSTEPGMFLSVVQDQVRALDPSLPPGSAKTMAQRMELPLWPARTAAGFLGICGTLALVLATVGLFGMTYLTVSQRTREFGIRAALGATPGRVMVLVLREGVSLTLPGVAIGLAGAAIAGRLLSSGFVGVNLLIRQPTRRARRSGNRRDPGVPHARVSGDASRSDGRPARGIERRKTRTTQLEAVGRHLRTVCPPRLRSRGA